jgi:hypothetical protein
MRRRTPEDLERHDAILDNYARKNPWKFNVSIVVIGASLVLLGSWLAEVIEAIGRGR